MRIGRDNIESYWPRKPRTFLDGVELSSGLITAADEEAGTVVFAIPGLDGHIFVDPRGAENDVRTVTLRGLVQITLDGADLSADQRAAVKRLWTVQKEKPNV